MARHIRLGAALGADLLEAFGTLIGNTDRKAEELANGFLARLEREKRFTG
ncbi:hypothetical protein [Propionivibrio soli]|nr:hypothetical protein [Propionivibrio soli]